MVRRLRSARGGPAPGAEGRPRSDDERRAPPPRDGVRGGAAGIGGEIAGRVAAEVIDRGDLRYLKNYEVEWQETFGKFLSYGTLKRELLEENWNKPEVDFEGLIRKTWIGFKEYYQDRKNWEMGNKK